VPGSLWRASWFRLHGVNSEHSTDIGRDALLRMSAYACAVNQLPLRHVANLVRKRWSNGNVSSSVENLVRSFWLLGLLVLVVAATGGCAEHAGTLAATHLADTERDSTTARHEAPTVPDGGLHSLLAPTGRLVQEPNFSLDAGVQLDGSVPQRPNPASLAEPGVANLDPADDGIVAPPEVIEDCEDRLTSANVLYRHAKLPVHKSKDMVCGTEQAIIYVRGPTGLRIAPTPVVSCGLALALAHFELVLDRTAQEFFGSPVVSVTQGGTYSCRNMARFRWVSEHSYANAIDLFEFVLANGKRINVLRHFGSPHELARTAEARFLRVLANRAYDERVFSVVVTRFFDELHRNHIHVDMARYRTDGTR
jgi:hypothetical protein